MTKNEFLTKYGDIKVSFVDYYKYVFTYEGYLPSGMTIRVSCGGNSDDIYRDSVTAGVWEPISSLYPFSGVVYNGSVEIDSFDDY